MTTQNGRAFNEWLQEQLKAKKMSQRQLAQQSGIDHSTISRLIRGDRTPSLATATALARGLRELRDDTDMPVYLNVVSAGSANPMARVEYALRADEYLTEAQVRQIMEYYIAVRTRRFGGRGPISAEPARSGSGMPVTVGPMGARPPARSVRPSRSGDGGGGTTKHPRARPGGPPRPGLGDSERRLLGSRRSRFPAGDPSHRWAFSPLRPGTARGVAPRPARSARGG
jgi:transcriptional regulator with XRE-family HTH domain